MALQFTVIILDRTTGSDVEQDVTLWYSANKSTIAKPARGTGRTKPSTVHLELDAGVGVTIKEKMEVWAGWRDTSTHVWATPPTVEDWPVGGIIDQIVGNSWGDKHLLILTVGSYDMLFRTTDIIGWPTGASDGFPTAGMAPGRSVTEWLVGVAGVGGATYNGLIRARLQGLDYSGVDSIWDSITIPLAALPGNDDFILGQWGFCLLDKALQDLVGAIRFNDSAREPVYFFSTGVNGTTLRPKFRFIDAQDTTTGTVVASFNVDTSGGEEPIE